jgi:hypothetical protein
VSVQRRCGIGEGSTTAFAADCSVGVTAGVANDLFTGASFLSKFAPLGYQYYSWLEFSVASGTTTWWGLSTHQISGLTGSTWG